MKSFDIFNPFSNGCYYYCKVDAKKLMTRIWWCQAMSVGGCRAVLPFYYLQVGRPKLSFLAWLCAYYGRRLSLILAWQCAQPNWYEPEALAIWWMGWNGLVVIYFIWICLSEFKLIWIVYIPLILEAFGAGNQVLILKKWFLFSHLCYSLATYTGIK